MFSADAKCVSLPDDKVSGLSIIRPDPESVLVNFKDNVTLNCNSAGRSLRNTASSTFRQCRLCFERGGLISRLNYRGVSFNLIFFFFFFCF